ncbi:cinnamoyl-CoA reductase-like SNL6 isoform X2 [Carica papaya]|uniref:cinnamoyl-CoA reductase-like SNL6 isoform X2 n=1 Tax=Carica papaya TaxID=3649 RepID=UPI000B8D06BB|nr:cinnamoyl-CoA reductase-like SNL6 isoform X2 [Carica papaya]
MEGVLMVGGVDYREKLLYPEMGKGGGCRMKETSAGFLSGRQKKLVCVTTGNSCLGVHIVKQLLARAYLVRITVQNQDLQEKMAILEREGARNVVEACSRAAYVKRCIFTSSLVASIWKVNSFNSSMLIDETCWSDEDFCRQNKLWFALGKTMAEKIAWRMSRELRVNLVTLCPALMISPSSFQCSVTHTSLPYLKGGQMMLQGGVLASVDVEKVAAAHLHVYEGMDNGASGRYLCFDRVVKRVSEAIEIENRLKIHGVLWRGRPVDDDEEELQTNLTNSKLLKLLLQSSLSSSCKQQAE